jgi:hypothetical protein
LFDGLLDHVEQKTVRRLTRFQALVECLQVRDLLVLCGVLAELCAQRRRRLLELEQRLTPAGGKPQQSTIENILKPMRGVMRLAVKEGLISASPFSLLDRGDTRARERAATTTPRC